MPPQVSLGSHSLYLSGESSSPSFSEYTAPGDHEQNNSRGCRGAGSLQVHEHSQSGTGIHHPQKLSGQAGESCREEVKLAAKETAKFSLVPKAGIN